MICNGKANEPEDPIAKNEEAFNTVLDSGADCDKEVWLAVIVIPAFLNTSAAATPVASPVTWKITAGSSTT
jgi:hypothetical protein